MAEPVAPADRYCRRCRYPLESVIGAAGIAADGLPPELRCPECGGRFSAADPRSTLDNPHGDAARALGDLARGMTFCSVLLCAVAFLVAAHGGYVQILWFLSLPALPFILVLVILLAIPRIEVTRSIRIRGLAATVVFLSIVLTLWPFRLTVLAHRGALNRFAAGVAAGTIPTGKPAQIGLIAVLDVEKAALGPIGLQLSGDAGGGVFLVYTPPACPFIWTNTNWEIDLRGGWWLVYQD